MTFRNSINWSYTNSGNPVAECSTGFHLIDPLDVLGNYDGGWIVSSVASGGGSGEYKVNNKSELSGNYERPFYSTVISDEQGSKSETDWNETWNINYKIVNNKLVRETDGKIVETYETSSWHSGDGSDDYSNDVTTEITNGTRTDHHEWNASISEGNNHSFKEVVTTNWSRKADENGNLVFDVSVTADLTTKANGNYSYYYFTKTTVDIDTDYDNYIDAYGSSQHVDSDSYSENTTTIDVSENYDSELTETWKFEYDNAAFTLDSRVGTITGSGISDKRDFIQGTLENHVMIHGWVVEVICPISLSESVNSDSFSLSETETLIHADYSSQGNFDGSLPFFNIINGFSTTRCKYQVDADSNTPHECIGCGACGVAYPYGGEHTLQEIKTTNFSYNNTVNWNGFGTGYVNIYDQVRYNQFTGGGSRSSYRDNMTPAHNTGSGSYGNNIAPKTNKIAAGELTVAKPEISFGNKPAVPGDEVPEPTLPAIPASNAISPPIPNESAWWAGLKAGVGTFFHGAATMAYDLGNHLTFGKILDSERFNDQVNAQGERLYNVAKNLGYSDASIAKGYGLAQGLAGEIVGTNVLAEAGTGYDRNCLFCFNFFNTKHTKHTKFHKISR